VTAWRRRQVRSLRYPTENRGVPLDGERTTIVQNQYFFNFIPITDNRSSDFLLHLAAGQTAGAFSNGFTGIFQDMWNTLTAQFRPGRSYFLLLQDTPKIDFTLEPEESLAADARLRLDYVDFIASFNFLCGFAGEFDHACQGCF